MNTVLYEEREFTPSKVICVGRNYVEHIEELGNEVPDEIIIFLKPNSSLSDDLQSHHHEQLHYEGELSFLCVGGKLSAVGFGLDLTKRASQSKLIEKGLPWERAKAFDGSAVFSNFVSFTGDLSSLSMRLEINGVTVQSADTDLMIHKPDEILAEVSRIMTLNDGDIIMTGTPRGVGGINAGDRLNGYISQNNELIIHKTWVAQ